MIQVIRSIVILSLLALPLPATAQSLDEKIRYILEINDTERVMDAAFEDLRTLTIDHLKKLSNRITPEIVDLITDIAADEVRQIKPEFLTFAVNLYKREWSEEEIGALYDFYKSPVGARIGRKMVKFTKTMLPQLQSFIGTQYMQRVETRIRQDERVRNALFP